MGTMFPSWLNPNKYQKELNNERSIYHAIFKIPLNASLEINQEEIIFACGCFWGAEKCFWKLPGVINTAVGYAGGNVNDPTYNQVCSGNTGHTEVVKVIWNNTKIDLSDLLKMFWECHDPTQGNRQGNDRGSQYRSAIYTKNKIHMDKILSSKNVYEGLIQQKGFNKITTEIKDSQEFYYAENYHQQYLAKPGSRPYCSAMPTKIKLGEFPGSNYLLPPEVWENFNWNIDHCVLRNDNYQINL